MSASKLRLPIGIIGGALFALMAAPASALGVFDTPQIGQYLLIGMGPENDVKVAGVVVQKGVGQAVNINDFEIGANKAPVPSTSGFAASSNDSGDGTSGPGIRGNGPNIPKDAQTVGTGIFGDGNVAITSTDGVFNLQDVGVFADPLIGIRCTQSKAKCDVGTSNSFFNDPNQFPNTFTPSPSNFPQSNPNDKNNNIDGTGVDINPNEADQTTRIDKPTQKGVTGNVDFSALLAEIDFLKTTVPGLTATATIDLRPTDGKLDKEINSFIVTNDLFDDNVTMTDVQIMDGRGAFGDNMNLNGLTTIKLAHGLNIIDIITKTSGGKDFVLQESSLVIDGFADSFAVFRVPDNANFLMSNANLLVGNSGIGLNNVYFYSDKPDNNAHFAMSNGVINGVALRTVGNVGGEINFQNVQGCTQLVADKIALDDVRLNRCAPGRRVPEPATLWLLGLAFAGLGMTRWRARR